MSNLTLLLNASRPFKPFQVEINDVKVDLFARKPSLGEQKDIDATFSETYQSTLEKYDTATSTADIFAGIRRLPAEKLARYIAEADRRDLTSESANELDKSDLTDSDVVALTETKINEREATLREKYTLEEMQHVAMQRRAHFYALAQAQEAMARVLASRTIYNTATEKDYLFATLEDVESMPMDDLIVLVSAANAAVFAPKKEATPTPLS
jgi:cation transport regulator ChaC